ncbi:hypothetical protein HH214_20910 [Mucilaginibacter robiniae]|uniref:DUF4747 family protein n=1 Tax=Mucilaginibacter robiniae TaxID=2728022 RepID=A0A7L5E771_9SPHI|nr:hypothetical protein [Mucilaginibacter robiniae]QJD98159.1 hypothetical protein HH214_20910 [Mucilaginibacter robiniae]
MSKKVLFYTLIKKNYVRAGGNSEPAQNVREVIEYVIGLSEVARQYDYADTKFCRLDFSDENRGLHKIIFKSANHRTRAPLMDRNAGTERDNPKLISEGERVMTHCIIKYTPAGVYLYLESGNTTLKIQQIVNYLNNYATQYHAHAGDNRTYSFEYEIIVKENFLQEMGDLNRVIEGEIIVDKRILGSAALDYSDRIDSVKHNIKIIISAERNFSISNALTDIFNKLNSGASAISKVRVRGKNDNNNNVMLDSEIIAKAEFVDVELHQQTGEVMSDSIFEQMEAIALAV